MAKKEAKAAESEAQEQKQQEQAQAAQDQQAQAQADAQKKADQMQKDMKKQAVKGMALGALMTLGRNLFSALMNKIR